MVVKLELRPFQVAGIEFLTKTKRAILADEMGLGKTVQAICTAEALNCNKILVICPSALKRNWENEIVKWGTEGTVILVEGDKADREAQISEPSTWKIMNYEQIRIHNDVLKGSKWDMVILDEAHKIKNRKALTTKAVKSLKTTHALALTGTPILGRAEDLWSLLNFIHPKVFSSYWKFVERYFRVVFDGFGYSVEGVKDPADFTKAFKHLILRREKGEVLKDLPAKQVIDIEVGMDPRQEKIYDQISSSLMAELGQETFVYSNVLVQYLRLKQCSIDPTLIDPQYNEAPLAGPKVRALMEILEGTDEKVIVYSQFKSVINRLEATLTNAGVSVLKLTGDVPNSKRQELIDQFQDSDLHKVFLFTTQAGGVGITLTAASIGVCLDKLWTPALQSQAEDRIHRISQTKDVTIYNIITESWIEEYVEGILVKKQDVVNSVMDNLSKLHTGLLDIESDTSETSR